MDWNPARPAAPPDLWRLDPEVTFLNHGSFGACPKAVLAYQQTLREQLEQQPVRFMSRELEPLLDQARAELASFVGADAQDFVFVGNATSGVNTVLRSLTFNSGDEILLTHHGYNACNNAARYVAERSGAKVVEARVPFPLECSEQVLEAVLAKVSPRTRLALVDHITSPTALVFPVAELVRQLREREVETLVDGAHAPGMLPLDLNALGAAYYTGNFHKWLCAPKTAALLHVRKDMQAEIRPLTISHGANSPRSDRSRFQIEFGWQGTWDPSACIAAAEALRYMGGLLPGGWPEIMQRNRALAWAARSMLGERFQVALPCPDEMIGSMATIPLPPLEEHRRPLHDCLVDDFGVELPVIPWADGRLPCLRISAQLYNALPDYERLADAVDELRASPFD